MFVFGEKKHLLGHLHDVLQQINRFGTLCQKVAKSKSDTAKGSQGTWTQKKVQKVTLIVFHISIFFAKICYSASALV